MCQLEKVPGESVLQLQQRVREAMLKGNLDAAWEHDKYLKGTTSADSLASRLLAVTPMLLPYMALGAAWAVRRL